MLNKISQIIRIINENPLLTTIVGGVTVPLLLSIFKFKKDKHDKVLDYTEEMFDFYLNERSTMKSAIIKWEYDKKDDIYVVKNIKLMCKECTCVLEKYTCISSRIDFLCTICRNTEIVPLSHAYKYEHKVETTIHKNIKKINKNAKIQIEKFDLFSSKKSIEF